MPGEVHREGGVSLLRRLTGRGPAARRRAVPGWDSLDLPWRDAEFAVVDLELTGLDLKRDEIVSYGGVVVRRGPRRRLDRRLRARQAAGTGRGGEHRRPRPAAGRPRGRPGSRRLRRGPRRPAHRPGARRARGLGRAGVHRPGVRRVRAAARRPGRRHRRAGPRDRPRAPRRRDRAVARGPGVGHRPAPAHDPPRRRRRADDGRASSSRWPPGSTAPSRRPCAR